MRSTFLPIVVGALLGAGLAGCADERTAGAPATTTAPSGAAARTATTTTTTTARSPLQRNAAAADRIVGEGPTDLRARIASLKGHPIVVNQWASWCGPCRFELPFFAAAAKKHAARVAFVGVDYMDSRDAALAFLEEVPAGFPSIFDPDGKAARAIGGGRVMPTTLIFGPDGRIRHTKLGGYANAEQLEADIERFALASS